jgi:SecD/SecF fusion protein
MFKQFFWKIVICAVPILLCMVVVAGAMVHEINQVDTFWDVPLPRVKLGTDLVGGTILVYEIDTRKLQAEGKDTADPNTLAKNLAQKLKDRIDPNDLYNVVIRPAGGEGRVEIILPTGSVERAQKAEEEWAQLLREMEAKYHVGKLDVPRGRIQELTDRILQLVQEEVWEKKLYNSPKARKELMDKALDASVKGSEEPQYLTPLFEEFSRERNLMADRAVHIFEVAWSGPLNVAPFVASTKIPGFTGGQLLDKYDPQRQSLFDYQTKTLRGLMKDVKDTVDDYAKEKEIDGWFKQQAWRKMISLVLEKWPILKEREAAFTKIAPDAIEELVGRVELKGDSVGQAYLVVMEPIFGREVLSDRYVDSDAALAKEPGKFLNGDKVLEFIKENYGPSAQLIEADIEKANKSSGRGRDLTVEEVQRIKDLISKVGSLEFRILANSVDDKEAEQDATEMLDKADSDPQLKAELDDDQNNGLPPPPPRKPGTKEPKVYTIKLRGGNSMVTYSWVELGQRERQDLHLNNNALQELGGGQAWSYLAARRKKATKIPLTGSAEAEGKYLLQGALFYSRECQDRNMPEEERRRKKYEYFVLTRNPEIDPSTGKETPKIDGSYLVSASNQADNSGRPAVSFTFNATGGGLFREVTRKNIPSGDESNTQVKRHLAIILDGLVMSAPTINSEIHQHGQISGSFTNREVDQLVNILRAGALPATLKPQPVSESTMGATLGQDTIRRGLIAIVVSFMVVLLFMIVYYRFAGLVASVALLANLILTVGFMVAVQATFTLPGLAGLVLMLGMAVDANILIYERLREERDRGASILLALRNGYDRALPTIIDTHLSSIFTAVVLYIVGNDQLKGFGVSLTVGLLISLFTSLFMTRLIFDFWAAAGWLRKLSMFRFFSRPDIDFMSIRYYLFALTGLLTILGGALFIGRLPNDLNIDFVGGTAYAGQIVETQAKTIEEMRAMLGEANQKDRLKAKAEEVKDSGGHRFTVAYLDGKDKWSDPRTVMLANAPDGNTPAERAKNVEKRASELPDWTVEQIFLARYKEDNPQASRFFTVRTTEKEPELVQATIDRLLQFKDAKGEWQPLLKKVQMEYDVSQLSSGRETSIETRVKFHETTADGKSGNLTSASPSFVTTLLTRELLTEFGQTDHAKLTDRAKLTFTFELAGEGPTEDGRFKLAKLTFVPKGARLTKDEKDKIKAALDRTVTEFRDRPQPERLETFDSQLAAETRLRAMYAILLSWAAILLYLWARFGSWTFGLAAVICLIHDLFFTLGVIAACHYINFLIPGVMEIEDFKIDLPAVAALLTLVGYSVNDTIVVFDRIREVRGKNPDLTPQMINDSVNQTLSRTLLSSLTTWLVVIVLYFFGGPGVHLFAFVMVVGVVVGTYSSIYVASPLLLLFGEGGKAPARTTAGGPAPIARQPDVRIQPAAP